ncbi:hypothetical protein BD310DRAFT_938638 [Dichomitus squalens]|uniref:Uncharacterized protein n=1 Tax=Dichomitus squalens TaxID=114155 RepID=A0A4Q9PHK8_9APHY|nr:hypothetical protein BD310DRAFT_938638 [Dichomitus squalens]
MRGRRGVGGSPRVLSINQVPWRPSARGRRSEAWQQPPRRCSHRLSTECLAILPVHPAAFGTGGADAIYMDGDCIDALVSACARDIADRRRPHISIGMHRG